LRLPVPPPPEAAGALAGVAASASVDSVVASAPTSGPSVSCAATVLRLSSYLNRALRVMQEEARLRDLWVVV